MSDAASGSVVAVDVGTSAVRAALVRGDHGGGRRLPVDPVRVPRGAGSGGASFDADALWADVTVALRALGDRLRGETPSVLVVSAHIGVVAVDEALRPVDAAGGWADPRGVSELAELAHRDPALAERVRRVSGRPALGVSALAAARALRARSDLARRVSALLAPKDFVVARLTGGVVATDTVDAAYTLLCDVRTRTWDTALADALEVDPAWLPPLTAPTALVGGLAGAVARETGLPSGLPVAAGGPDGSVGIGLLAGSRSDVVADVAGTTDMLGRVVADPGARPPAAVLNPALVSDHWIAGGPTGMTGGAVARWRDLVGAVDDTALAAVTPGCDGLLMVPTLSGARFPRWDPNARGVLRGLDATHGPAHVLRAAQEGAALVAREAVDVLDPPGAGDPRPVVLAGGAARSAHVAQLRADVLGRRVLVCAEPDVSLLGAAALGLLATGAARDLDHAREDLAPDVRALEPDPARAERYVEVAALWRAAADGGAVDAAGSRRPSPPVGAGLP